MAGLLIIDSEHVHFGFTFSTRSNTSISYDLIFFGSFEGLKGKVSSDTPWDFAAPSDYSYSSNNIWRVVCDVGGKRSPQSKPTPSHDYWESNPRGDSANVSNVPLEEN